MLRTLIMILLIYSTTLTAAAQSLYASTMPLRSTLLDQKPISDWPGTAQGYKLPQNSLDVVTIDQSTIRQRCHVREVEADTLTCRTPHHRADTVYQRDNILALIEPPAHENLFCYLEAAGIVAVPLAASFFVPFAWSLVLRFATGFLFYGGGAGCGETFDGLASLGYRDHNHDILLYQRLDTPLTIRLR